MGQTQKRAEMMTMMMMMTILIFQNTTWTLATTRRIHNRKMVQKPAPAIQRTNHGLGQPPGQPGQVIRLGPGRRRAQARPLGQGHAPKKGKQQRKTILGPGNQGGKGQKVNIKLLHLNVLCSTHLICSVTF